MRWHPIWASVHVPAAPVPIQLPACGLGKQPRTAQSLGTLHLHGRPEEAQGSWSQIKSAPDVAASWGVNHQTEDLLCLSSLYIWFSSEINNFLKIQMKSMRRNTSTHTRRARGRETRELRPCFWTCTYRMHEICSLSFKHFWYKKFKGTVNSKCWRGYNRRRIFIVLVKI